jgi:hypothetical protein
MSLKAELWVAGVGWVDTFGGHPVPGSIIHSPLSRPVSPRAYRFLLLLYSFTKEYSQVRRNRAAITNLGLVNDPESLRMMSPETAMMKNKFRRAISQHLNVHLVSFMSPASLSGKVHTRILPPGLYDSSGGSM